MKFSKLWIGWNVLIASFLAGSVFLNMRLYNRAKHYYVELNATRLDPIGLNYYPIHPQVPIEANSLRVVFFGDSRAANWIAPQVPNVSFLNRGISSQTSVQTLQRFSPHVSSLKPDVVIIQVGINDLKTIALFPDQSASIIANCQRNIRRLVTQAKQLGAVVIITTIFPAGAVPLERLPFWSEAIGPAIRAVNADIATLADEQTLVLDTFTILADSQGVMLRQYRQDELHLNQQGYDRLNQQLMPLIQSIQARIPKNSQSKQQRLN